MSARRRVARPMPEFMLDARNVVVAVMPLSGGFETVLDAEDLYPLLRAYGSYWLAQRDARTGTPYVKASIRRPKRGGANTVAVARVILGARTGQRVVYRNGTLDLRRHQLALR